MSRTPSIAQVYIFEAETGLIKIGYTTNPEQRVRKIQTYSGFKIKRQSVSPRCFNYREEPPQAICRQTMSGRMVCG